jgi:hypothetical protein
MDRRAARDLEFGRRLVRDAGIGNFTTAIDTRRVILKYQLADQATYKGELFRTRNNLAYALQESSRRNDGEAGDKQIAEAVALLEEALDTMTPPFNETHRNIARANLAQALGFRAARRPGLEGQADIDRAFGLFAEIDKTLTADNDPRLWAIVKQFEAEFHRMVGERTPDPQKAFNLFKSSFEMSQGVLKVISKETAPNDWAMVCAEMGYAFVSALAVVADAEDRKTFARNAVSLLNAAREVFDTSAFRWDVQRVDRALKIASALLDPNEPPPPVVPR